jgi:mono/diheme cytochrome c family protein
MFRTRSVNACILLAATSFAMPLVAQHAVAADVAAGQAKVAQLCAECHRPRDWSGETTAALQSLIADIVAGKIKHSQRKIELTPQEIADIAAYWTSGRK